MKEIFLQSGNNTGMENIPLDKNVPLPRNIQLLSSQELHELMTRYCDQLALYINRLHPQDRTKQRAVELKQELNEIYTKFQGLQEKRSKVQQELEECRVLESQYVKKYQDLNTKIQENYSDEELKSKFDVEIMNLDRESDRIEVEAKYDANIDKFVREYIDIRTRYHIQREKMSTWSAQGKLQI